MFKLSIDCAYLSVNGVNGIGENSNFSSLLRAELHCAFISCVTCMTVLRSFTLFSELLFFCNPFNQHNYMYIDTIKKMYQPFYDHSRVVLDEML